MLARLWRRWNSCGCALFMVAVLVGGCAAQQPARLRSKRQPAADGTTVFQRRHLLLSGVRAPPPGTQATVSANTSPPSITADKMHFFKPITIIEDNAALSEAASGQLLQQTTALFQIGSAHRATNVESPLKEHLLPGSGGAALFNADPAKTVVSTATANAFGSPETTLDSGEDEQLHVDEDLLEDTPDTYDDALSGGNELYYIYELPNTDELYEGVDVWQRRANVAAVTGNQTLHIHDRILAPPVDLASSAPFKPQPAHAQVLNDQTLLFNGVVHERSARDKIPPDSGAAATGASETRKGPAPPPRDPDAPIDRATRQSAGGSPPAIMPKDTPLGKPPAIRPFHTLKTSEERQQFRAEMERRALQWRRFRVLQALRAGGGGGNGTEQR